MTYRTSLPLYKTEYPKKPKRRQKKKGVTKSDTKVVYSETKPTGETKITQSGVVPIYETKNVTKVLPKGTKGKEVIVKNRKGEVKKIKRKYKTKDAVYKSKQKLVKKTGQGRWCTGPGASCESGAESVRKRKRIFKKKK